MADDEPRPAIEEMSLQHLHHLASLREDLLMYLALPIGWSFVVLDDGLRTWTAHSPSAQVAADVEEFMSPEGSIRSAESIKDVLDECFGDIQAARDLSRSIGTYLAGEAGADGLMPRLEEIAAIIRGTAGDGRIT